MQTKRETVFVPKDMLASEVMPYVEKELKHKLVDGWKIGGVVHSESEDKTVILYK